MAEKQKLYICESTENEPMNQRYGEFSPNNPAMRVTTQPFLGLGEYDHRREMLMNQRKAEYAQHQYTEKVKSATDHENKMLRSNFIGSRAVSNSSSSIREKASQTDIQNVQSHLVQYEYRPHTVEKAAAARNNNDSRHIDKQNNHNTPSNSKYGHSSMDAYGNAIDTVSSPRARHMADLQSSCFPKIQGCPYVNTDAQEKAEKQRRQEKYQDELRQQIEEKQRLVARHKQEERQEDRKLELENQLRDINNDEKHGYGRRSYSSDTPLSARERTNKPERTFSKHPSTTPRWHTDNRYVSRMLDSSLTHHSDPTDNKFTTSKHSLNSSSPPLHRREQHKPYSFNIAPNSVFANSIPVKDNTKQLHSKQLTKQTMNNDIYQKRMLQLLNANNTNNKLLDDSLPIPVLKTQYPVAKELKNAVVVHSTTSDAMRKLEDKWQIPAVQRNIIKSTPERKPGQYNSNGILTQLGAIRLQLQQEQLRLDETLRKRGSSQTVIRADVHHNHN